MMHLNQNSAVRVTLEVLLLLVLVLPVVGNADAQTTIDYVVTVAPATSKLTMHASASQNFSVTFQVWCDNGHVLSVLVEANITVEVKTGHGDIVEKLTQTTNVTGYIAINYSFPVPVILTFMPVRAVTRDGNEWNVSLSNFQYTNVTVHVDTFEAELVSVNTETLGRTFINFGKTCKQNKPF